MATGAAPLSSSVLVAQNVIRYLQEANLSLGAGRGDRERGRENVCMCKHVRAHRCVWIYVCTSTCTSTNGAAEEAKLLILGKLRESYLMKV